MPGGMVADLRTGQLRKMECTDFLTKRLRFVATNTPTLVYDYFLGSISSANDQPADLEWMGHFELLHGYFLIGHYNFHIWPIWTGGGGNGKSENARLIKSTLGDFCAVVRWSELAHDERGGDNTTKRLNFKLLQSRVALVEEMGPDQREPARSSAREQTDNQFRREFVFTYFCNFDKLLIYTSVQRA